jgi:hypothetical protein
MLPLPTTASHLIRRELHHGRARLHGRTRLLRRDRRRSLPVISNRVVVKGVLRAVGNSGCASESLLMWITNSVKPSFTRFLLVFVGLWSLALPANAQVNVTQFHNHASRDGLYIDSAFTPSAAATFTLSHFTSRTAQAGERWLSP